jgi:hypothetical protein
MQEPFEYQQPFYTQAITYLEQKWGRKLDDHERNILIEGYRFGRLIESEQEFVLWTRWN